MQTRLLPNGRCSRPRLVPGPSSIDGIRRPGPVLAARAMRLSPGQVLAYASGTRSGPKRNTVHFSLKGKPQAIASALNSRLRLAVKRSRWIDAKIRTVLRLGNRPKNREKRPRRRIVSGLLRAQGEVGSTLPMALSRRHRFEDPPCIVARENTACDAPAQSGAALLEDWSPAMALARI